MDPTLTTADLASLSVETLTTLELGAKWETDSGMDADVSESCGTDSVWMPRASNRWSGWASEDSQEYEADVRAMALATPSTEASFQEPMVDRLRRGWGRVVRPLRRMAAGMNALVRGIHR